MSKAKLKKEMANLTKEQLIEVILDCYEFKGEAKEFFKFYLNPDINAVTEQFRTMVIKEAQKSKRGHCAKMRFTFFNTLCKKYETLNDNKREVLDFRFFILNVMTATSVRLYFSDAQETSVSRFMFSTCMYAEANLMGDVALKHFVLVIEKGFMSRTLRTKLINTLTDSLGVSMEPLDY